LRTGSGTAETAGGLGAYAPAKLVADSRYLPNCHPRAEATAGARISAPGEWKGVRNRFAFLSCEKRFLTPSLPFGLQCNEATSLLARRLSAGAVPGR
jgi:hypothetical protein